MNSRQVGCNIDFGAVDRSGLCICSVSYIKGQSLPVLIIGRL
jgi:hypothetical protein